MLGRLRSRLKLLGRYRHIVAVLTKYGFEEAGEAIRSRFPLTLSKKKSSARAQKKLHAHTRAERVRLVLEELGPAFIKFGQLLSTRPDLVSSDYINELERLQDQVAPEKPERIRIEIENQLKDRVENIFQSFDAEPIAAGSIAHVHRATAKEDGKLLAVKIRRPQIVETVHAECEILEDLAGLLKASLFKEDTVDPKKMVRELNEAISKEVSMDSEKRNQLRFHQSFADDPAVHVPKVYEKYCTDGVLTMEYIEGIKATDKQAIEKARYDTKLIAKRGANFVLRQIFEFGFFHADPHPGNFFLLPDNVLAPLDFGQVAYLSVQDRKLLNEVVLAIVDNEAAVMINAFERAEMIGELTDVDQLARDMEQLLSTYHNLPLKEIPFGKVISQAFALIRKHHINPPAQFTLMLKSLATIESFALSLDPDFQIIEQLKPYARQFSLRDIDPKQILKNARKTLHGAGNLALRLPEDVNAILTKFRQGKFLLRVNHEHLEGLIETLDKSSNRISFALIIAALLIGSSLLVPQEGKVLGLVTLQTLGVIGYVFAAVIGIWLIISIIRSRHL